MRSHLPARMSPGASWEVNPEQFRGELYDPSLKEKFKSLFQAAVVCVSDLYL